MLSTSRFLRMIAHHRHRHSHQLLSLHSQSSSTAAAASDLHSAAADKQEDVLYHLGITSNDPVIEDFKDARLLIMGGSASRAAWLVDHVASVVGHDLPRGAPFTPIFDKVDRYTVYKAGPVVVASHGIGMPSHSVLLHEMTKVFRHAGLGAGDVTYMRMGTCGGLGIAPGTAVVSTETLNAQCKPELTTYSLGSRVSMPAIFPADLAQRLSNSIAAGNADDDNAIPLVSGKTMAVDDFYVQQGRTDGAFTMTTPAETLQWLKGLQAQGVANIEMESLGFAAFCHHLGIPACQVAITLLDRLLGDQVTLTKEQYHDYSNRRLATAVLRFVESHLQHVNDNSNE